MQATFPIIVGSRRSGTTLLRAIFDSHPELAVANEAHFIVPLARRLGRFQNGGRFEKRIFLDNLARDSGWRRLKLTKEAVETAFQQVEVTSFADAVRLVFSVYARTQGKHLYGDKTPSYVKHVGLLGTLFPEARFLHVVRDGRDVAASTLEAPFGPTTITEAAWAWREAVTRGRRDGSSLGSVRYREIRYEELVSDPQNVVQSACRFVGIRYDERMLDYHRRAKELLAFTGRPDSHLRLSEPPSRRRDWRSELSATDVRKFEAIAGPTLNQFGYSRANPRTALSDLAVAGWSGTLWRTKRLRYALRRTRRALA